MNRQRNNLDRPQRKPDNIVKKIDRFFKQVDRFLGSKPMKCFLLLFIVSTLILSAVEPVYATVDAPDTLEINQVEVYANCLEVGDQLYLITGTVDYTVNPDDNIETNFVVRLMDGTDELGNTIFYAYFDDGYEFGTCAIYFSAADAPTWEGDYTVYIQGNPTVDWDGDPPETHTSAFSLWFDEDTTLATRERLTTRLRALALFTEISWGATAPDLIAYSGDENKLTEYGDDYFSNSIPRLREVCPDLFLDVITTPEFDERDIITNSCTSSENDVELVYGVNWYAQTFEALSSYTITGARIKIYMYDPVAPPIGDLTLSLRTTAFGLPTGADLVSGTLDASQVTQETDGAWYFVPFTTDYTLTAHTTYAIVARVVGGDINNYVAWLSSDASGCLGQACVSPNSGVGWGVIMASDFMYVAEGRNTQTLSYRDRLAARLIGTPLDFSNLGTNLNLSRMWTGTIIWLVFACGLPTYFLCKSSESFKPATLVFALMMPFGALAGFVYLEVALFVSFMCAAGAIYVFWYQKSP